MSLTMTEPMSLRLPTLDVVVVARSKDARVARSTSTRTLTHTAKDSTMPREPDATLHLAG